MTRILRNIVFLLLYMLLCLAEGHTQPSSTWYNSDQILWPSALSGGILAPQFSSFDMDQDGTNEIIIFDRFSGIIQVWAWNGMDISYQLVHDLAIDWPQMESWMLVRDYNNDNIPDLFSQGLHGISVYKGIKDGSGIRFEKQEGESFIDDSLVFFNKFGSKTNIYHAASDIPIIEDVDNDGDLDIMSFELSGSYLYYYRNDRNNSGKDLDFSLQHNCWGYFAEDQFSDDINLADSQYTCPPPFSVRHAGSASCIVDVNLDSIPDLLIGDIGSNAIKVLINNNGIDTGFIIKNRPAFPDQESPAILRYFPSAYKLDINQDHIDDIIVSVNDYPLTDTEGIWTYIGTRDSAHPFILNTKHWLQDQYIDLGQYSSPYFMDINGDDIQDLLVSYQISEYNINPQNKIAYFEALGPNEFQLKSNDFGSLSDKITNGFRPYITSGDIDDDGDQDILIGMSNGSCFLIRNISNEINQFESGSVEHSWAGLELLSGATPELYDIDSDGDLDVISGSDNGTIGVYINTGDKVIANFHSDLTQWPNVEKLGNIQTIGQNNLLGRSAPRVIHNGGDTLLVSGSNHGKLYIYRVNSADLSSEFNQIALEGWPHWLGKNGRVALGLNSEGKSRLIAGNIAGGLTENLISMDMISSSTPVQHRFNFYPNPVISGQDLNLSMYHPDQFKKIIVIYPTGKVIQSTKVSGTDLSIPTSGWRPGMYYLQIILADNSSMVQKVVVQ